MKVDGGQKTMNKTKKKVYIDYKESCRNTAHEEKKL
jgi:hypothetical protein